MNYLFKKPHWSLYLFLGAVGLSLMTGGFVASQTYWSLVWLDGVAAVLALPYGLLVLAFLVELGRKAAGQPARAGLVGVLAGLGLGVLLATLTLLGPLVAPYSGETFTLQSARFNDSIYYIGVLSGPEHRPALFRCNQYGWPCRQVIELSPDALTAFSLQQTAAGLQIRHNTDIVYTVPASN
ncbi:MAG: hypothetical protein FOGNACKC_04479 [Anaerolineae bacterium]|nr:hypothetical protein [Anaerolineae bacterium]